MCFYCLYFKPNIFKTPQKHQYIVIYLESVAKFRNQTSDRGRFMIARNIVATSIKTTSKLPLNISHETREIVCIHLYILCYCT